MLFFYLREKIGDQRESLHPWIVTENFRKFDFFSKMFRSAQNNGYEIKNDKFSTLAEFLSVCLKMYRVGAADAVNLTVCQIVYWKKSESIFSHFDLFSWTSCLHCLDGVSQLNFHFQRNFTVSVSTLSSVQ